REPAQAMGEGVRPESLAVRRLQSSKKGIGGRLGRALGQLGLDLLPESLDPIDDLPVKGGSLGRLDLGYGIPEDADLLDDRFQVVHPATRLSPLTCSGLGRGMRHHLSSLGVASDRGASDSRTV